MRASTSPLNPDGTVRVTLVLRRRADLPDDAGMGGHLLKPEELAARYGADPADVRVVESAMEQAGLTVVGVDAASRRMRVEGTIAQVSKVFATTLRQAEIAGGTYRVRSGSVSVPDPLGEIVVAVLGLDDRPQAHIRSLAAVPAAAVSASFTPLQIAELYEMPEGDGSGQTIAIIELGGGFIEADLEHYFRGLGITPPTVTAVSVDGAENAPDGGSADGEVMLDIEVAGALAPKAEILVYFAPNTDAGFLDAVATAAHTAPAAISISWGQSEDQWTAQARQAMDDAFADAAAMGVVVTAAAGDNGSGDNDPTTSGGSSAHTDFPASSPHALGCGGTSLRANGSRVESEVVWHDGGRGGATGGGVSSAFPVPSWQAGVGVPARAGVAQSGRGVPDIAGNADPETGYQVYVNGRDAVIGGTSAVSPLWAGLIARITQARGSLIGLPHPLLYADAGAESSPQGLRDITEGSNGAYVADSGWDACTGLGVPASGVEALLTR